MQKSAFPEVASLEDKPSNVAVIDGASAAVRMVVILAGATGRLAGVRDQIGRNLFDLPGVDKKSLLAHWQARLADLLLGMTPPVLLRLAIDQSAPEPFPIPPLSHCPLEVIRDANPTRGTAGLLRDVTNDVEADDQLLVIQASDLGWHWSAAEGGRLLASEADIVLSADRDLRPAGPVRVRGGLLKRIPSIGFVDFKEQFLARCAGHARFEVLRSDRPRLGTLHTLRAYLDMLEPTARVRSMPEPTQLAMPRFSGHAVVEAGAEVDPTAVLSKAVILRGARVHRDAVIVRSLIGTGVTIAAGEQVVDRTVVAGPRGRSQDVYW